MASGSPPTGNVDDVIRQLQELVNLTKVVADSQRATQHVLQNPELKVGGPYTATGRWWERQKTWGGLFKSSVQRGQKMGRYLGGGLGRMLGGTRVGKMLGMGSGRKGLVAGAQLGGALGSVAGGAVTVALSLREANKAIGEWTDRMLESNRRLAEVSGLMAAVMAQRDIDQMMRDMQKGDATAASANSLSIEESRRKDAENRIDIVFTKIGNGILETLNSVASDILEPIADFVEYIAKVAEQYSTEKMKKDAEPKGLAAAAVDAVRQRERINAHSREMMEKARRGGIGGAVGPSGALPGGKIGMPTP